MPFSRRAVIAGMGSSAAVALLPVPLAAAPEDMRQAMRETLGPAPPLQGRLKLEIPIISETGNAVRLLLRADSPMTEADHVTRMHVFSEGNPLPHIVTFHLGPRAGKAEVETRIRIAQDQTVVAVAEMSDGSRWTDAGHIIVALGACADDFFGNDSI